MSVKAKTKTKLQSKPVSLSRCVCVCVYVFVVLSRFGHWSMHIIGFKPPVQTQLLIRFRLWILMTQQDYAGSKLEHSK